MTTSHIVSEIGEDPCINSGEALPAPQGFLCAYCNRPIRRGQPTVPDEWGERGARMHIGCAAEDQDGRDLDRDMGDS